KREVPQAEIFGEEVSWRCGERTRCSYPPRGTPDQLWEFYQGDESFLASWSPLASPDAETRQFGYALSELVVRDYVRRNGPDALHPVYNELQAMNREMDRQLSGRAATRRLQQVMDTDLRPCSAADRDVFDRCLDAVHSMEPRIPDPVDTGRTVNTVPIQPVEQPSEPNRTVRDRLHRSVTPVQEQAATDARRLLQALDRLVTGLVAWLLG
ncbi:MAG: hypothetical protein SVW77_03165, partial [Candidatus Nanohaloarchaea archaeon]|nr:hypothetical protein [Candidatus Nanohaloarchaea archaeon]